jgi:hypothetical protein
MPDLMEDIDAQINASRTDGQAPTPPPAPSAPTAQPPAQATQTAAEPDAPVAPADPTQQPAAPEKPSYALDDVILNDSRLPPSLRGKPASEIYQYALDLKHKHDQIGFQKNQAVAENIVLQKALEVLQKFAPAQTTATEPPKPKPSVVDVVRQRIDPKVGWEEPDKLAAAAAEVGAEFGAQQATERLQPVIDKLTQSVEALTQGRQQDVDAANKAVIANAYKDARPDDVPENEWFSQAQLERIAAVVLQEHLPQNDPASYRKADEILLSEAARRYERKQTQSTAAVATTAQPVAPNEPATAAATSAPAPPVGGGKTAPVAASKPRSTLDNHTQNALNELGSKFGFDPTVMEQIAEETMNDPRFRRHFV